MFINRFKSAATAAAIVLLSIFGSANAQTYTLTDLGDLGGDTFAFGINKSGQITGYSNDTFAGQPRAFLYSKGQLVALGEAGGLRSSGYRINDAGAVAGSIDDNLNVNHAVVWKNGIATFIGSLGGSSGAIGINQSGMVVGASQTSSNGPQHAFLYNGTAMLDLGTLGGPNSSAVAINRSGQVVGAAGVNPANAGDTRAFLYSGGVMTNLGSLFGGISGATDINDNGEIVGYSYVLSIGGWMATLWRNGTMQNLGTVAEAQAGSWPYAINNKGLIVGQTQGHTSGVNHALIWRNGSAVDLNTLVDASGLGWTLENAMDVNDAGLIVGWGKNNAGQTRAILLTPIPQHGKKH